MNRDKIKRDIVTQARDSGGLDMYYPEQFLSSMKLKLITKIGDYSFNHKWKDIVINQVNHPDHPGICFENGLVNSAYSFTDDLVQCYADWKSTAAKYNTVCINHCIWGNNLITDIGSKLWFPKLIDYNINYLSDFVNTEGEVMTYKEFCSKTLDHCWHIISKREYVNLKMAIRRFNIPNIPQRNICNIDSNLCLNFFIVGGSGGVKARKIRDMCINKIDTNNILPMQNWSRDLGKESIDWRKVFRNLCPGGFTNNFRLIQFQYKLLMRITTCRYMRYKMNIDTNSPNCIHCKSIIETLHHIFLDCPKTFPLIIYLEYRIINYLDNNYDDPDRFFYITCSHENPFINFIWAAFKSYLSRCFQLSRGPSLKFFEYYVKSNLVGENEATIRNVNLTLDLE